ncbi:SusC/RagA family TonB-linked outer membrane protein [Zhouia sp. PK063]|uniref:SusC/RagA family TonB-linked outer membrane protein n=1 Tax=Zhouia sp. PK063 TaxID=3373602 RepID=UPI00378A3566
MKFISKNWGCRYIYAIFLMVYLLPYSVTHARGYQQQQFKISGTVSDAHGPLAGVTVRVSGSRALGTFTNFDGEFSLSVTASDTLVCSFIGYQTLKVPVGKQRQLSITLVEDVTALSEVTVNAGYYTVTERERTGSIAKVSGDEIAKQPVISPLEALQGRMAGVEITQPTGIPGAAPHIQIRGQNSLRRSLNDNGNLPLYIVDGVPLNSSPVLSQNGFLATIGTDPLNGLNLGNIQSIEILKDADATAIYGSRGANGVVLITTKNSHPKIQKTVVSADVYTGVSKVAHMVDMLNTPQYIALRQQAFDNDGATPSTNNAFDLLVWDQSRYTNWQKKLFGGTATITNVNVNVTGGGEYTSFLVGAGYQKQGTVFPGDFTYQKKTMNLNLNHRSPNDKFHLNLTANYAINTNNLFSDATFISTAFSLPPNAPELYQEDGSLNWENSTWTNPLAALEADGNTTVHQLLTNMSLQYQFSKVWAIKANLGYTDLDSEEKIKLPVEIYDPTLWNRSSNRSQHYLVHRKSWTLEPQLVYNQSFGEHHLNALVGTSFQKDVNSSLRVLGTGYSDRHLIGNLAAADAVTVSENQQLFYKYNAVFARIGYNYRHTYFVNLTGRRDGSSRFGPGKRFANFGAVGVAYLFSNEDFFKNSFSFLSFGKIRASYGRTGNDQIGDYRYLDAYETTPGPGGLYPTQLTNPDFSWETNKKLEGALQLGVLKDRINIELNWYRNRSSNQLVGYPLPAMTGFTSVEANLPATVQNTGWEIMLSTLNAKSNRFSWRTAFNLTLPKNKLIAFPDIQQTSYSNTYRVGQPLNLAILYSFQGLDSETGRYTVKDVNDDGVFNVEDRIAVKHLGRQYYGGLQNQIDVHQFSLRFLWEFVKQNGYKFSAKPPGRLGNTLKSQSPYANDPGNIQTPSQSIYALLAYNNYAYSSDFAITDASYIRLKTISLGYALPKSLLHLIGLSKGEVFLHAQNLFTITNYIGLDPQYTSGKNLPALQSITLGMQLNF